MYNITTTTESASYECNTCDLDIALYQFFLSAKMGLPVRVMDGYTGEVYVIINDDSMENYITDEWKYILIGYYAHNELSLDVLGFEGVEEDV